MNPIFELFPGPSSQSIIWIALLIYFSYSAFSALMVWGVMRARTGVKPQYTNLLLRGLGVGLLAPVLYAASDNDDLMGKLAIVIFALGIPGVMIFTAVRDWRKLKS